VVAMSFSILENLFLKHSSLLSLSDRTIEIAEIITIRMIYAKPTHHNHIWFFALNISLTATNITKSGRLLAKIFLGEV
jgi:hypothetical protein